MGAVLFVFVAGGVLVAVAIAHANTRRGVSKSGGASRDTDSDGGYAGDSGSSTWFSGGGTDSDSGSCDAGSSGSSGSDCGSDCGGGDSGGGGD